MVLVLRNAIGEVRVEQFTKPSGTLLDVGISVIWFREPRIYAAVPATQGCAAKIDHISD